MENDIEILKTTPRKDIQWIDSLNVQHENTTTYDAMGYSKFYHVNKTRHHQAFTRVQMLPTSRMGKAIGNKPKGMKYKVHIRAGVNIIPLSTYQCINCSEFDKEDKPIDHGQDRSILKNCCGSSIWKYGIRFILGINNTGIFFNIEEAQGPILLWLNRMGKWGSSSHPWVSTETTDIHQEQHS